jgi:hypothetical protein
LKTTFKYIFSFFLILSLLGLGENLYFTASNVKNDKQSEWVTKTDQTGKVSNCYHYNLQTYFIDKNLDLHSWSNDFSIYYNRTVVVRLLSQANELRSFDNIILVFNKLLAPRKSVEYHHIFSFKTDAFMQDCLSCSIRHDIENIRWNHLLNKKWQKQNISSLASSMELNAL